MGTWGTAIKDSDAFADIYSQFFELYNKGAQPDNISQKMTTDNCEMLEIEEEKNSFWFALALAQWETKSPSGPTSPNPHTPSSAITAHTY